MTNTSYYITRLGTALAMCLMVVAMSLPARATVSESDRRKAEYLLVEAQNAKSQGRADAYWHLLQQAHAIDPGNTTVAFYMGYCMLTMDNTTRSQCEEALGLMRQHFEEAPEDLYETTFYSDANLQLGHPDEALRAIKVLNDANPNRLELQARLAEAYARTGDYTSSNATYDSITALHGKSIQVTSKKLNNYVAQNDSTGAINEMRSLLATAPQNAMYNLTMSGVMQHFGQTDSALAYLNLARDYEPDNGYVYLARAQFYAMQGDSASYDHEVYSALTTPSLDVDAKLEVLLGYIRGQLASADTTQRVNNLFTALLQQHPHEAKIRDLYSQYLVARNDYKGAAEQLGYSLDLNPTDANGWRNLMLINMMDENFPAAIRAAERALEYNPDSLDLYTYIAPAYFQMKEYDKALQTYDKALAMVDSADLETMSNLIGGKGDVYFEMGDTTLAFETYEQALALFPNNAGIMNNYAYFLTLCNRDLDKAERLAARAVQGEPGNVNYLDTYAWVYFVKQDYSMALMYIKRAYDQNTTPSVELLEHYGDILYFNDDAEQAVQMWQQALELEPDNATLQQKVKTKTYIAK